MLLVSGDWLALLKCFPGLVETHVVGSAPIIRIIALNVVILPTAHLANIKMSGLVIK